MRFTGLGPKGNGGIAIHAHCDTSPVLFIAGCLLLLVLVSLILVELGRFWWAGLRKALHPRRVGMS